jgi:hypothetical protein
VKNFAPRLTLDFGSNLSNDFIGVEKWETEITRHEIVSRLPFAHRVTAAG